MKTFSDNEQAAGAGCGIVGGALFGGLVGLGHGLMTLHLQSAIGLSILMVAAGAPLGLVVISVWMAWVGKDR